MSISKKLLLSPSALALIIHIFFKPSHSTFMIFHVKIVILGEYLYVSHTLFILYLEENHALFGEKIMLYLEIFAVATLIKQGYLNLKYLNC